MLDSVHFKFQTAQLLSECQSKIGLIVAWAQRNPSEEIELQGYLDQREALNKYSWNNGDRRRLLCSEGSESCWQQNRRVEVVVAARAAR